MDEKRALVLFYDHKDRERQVRAGATLEAEVRRGFEGTGIACDIHTASPQHEGWLVRAYLNAAKYDVVISAGGLSCSLDLARMCMEELYDSETIHISPRDWKGVKVKREEGKLILKEYADQTITIEKTESSRYFKQERPVPIIGLPTSDDLTDGVVAFSSMVMSGRPSSAACVGVDQGYAAGQLIAKMLNNSWNGIQFVVHQMHGHAYDLGCSAVALLNQEFKAYDDGKIPFEICTPPELRKNTLPVVFYENFNDLRAVARKEPFIIGVHVPSGRLNFTEFVKNTHGIENVIHTRPGVGENAAMFAVQCLYFRHPKLKPSRFVDLRRARSLPHVQEYLELTNSVE
ncbi:hypothetical protein J4211_02090 [Candidatus Woesearchaeota archaeon]|nr:hypothetical protein [Candidatus Woesearchaeota archaeon]